MFSPAAGAFGCSRSIAIRCQVVQPLGAAD
jgi:hypothetical protein